MEEECKLIDKKYHQNVATNINNNTVTTTTHMLVLPYKREKVEKLVKPLDNHVKKVLTENRLYLHAYRSKKLGFFFNIKDHKNWNALMTQDTL